MIRGRVETTPEEQMVELRRAHERYVALAERLHDGGDPLVEPEQREARELDALRIAHAYEKTIANAAARMESMHLAHGVGRRFGRTVAMAGFALIAVLFVLSALVTTMLPGLIRPPADRVAARVVTADAAQPAPQTPAPADTAKPPDTAAQKPQQAAMPMEAVKPQVAAKPFNAPSAQELAKPVARPQMPAMMARAQAAIAPRAFAQTPPPAPLRPVAQAPSIAPPHPVAQASLAQAPVAQAAPARVSAQIAPPPVVPAPLAQPPAAAAQTPVAQAAPQAAPAAPPAAQAAPPPQGIAQFTIPAASVPAPVTVAALPPLPQQPRAAPPAQAPPAQAAPAQSPVRLVAMAGTHAAPPYPDTSRRLGEEGSTQMQVAISATGAVTDCNVTQSSGSQRLDAAACSYVQARWRWQPPTRDGNPTAASTRVTVVWSLSATPR